MIHLIFLAAGYSTRFGSNKLLYCLDGKEMYRHLLDRLILLCFEEPDRFDLTVVTQYPRIREALAGEELILTMNEDPSRGISSSLIKGIQALCGRGILQNGDWMMFLNGDQPGLMKETVRAFAAAAEGSGMSLAACAKDGEMMSPCMFQTRWLQEFLSLRGDRGGKRILRAREKEVFLFQPECTEELVDIDLL